MSEHVNKLVWNPIIKFLDEQIKLKRQLCLIIVPFIKIASLKHLLENCDDISTLRIIVRWSGQDIINRVTDLEIYPYLENKRVPLYINPNIHLKLYVFDNAYAFHSSSNITKKGLGLIPSSNVEIGCMVGLNQNDWKKIYGLLQGSSRVDKTMYENALKFFNDYSKSDKTPPLVLKPSRDKDFSILSLPASVNPESLFSFYKKAVLDNKEMISSYIHDLILYEIQENLDRDIFFQQLRTKFKNHSFVLAIVELIKNEGSARFGLVNEWIQLNCSDKPTPYKWEIKQNTHFLYNWLDYFYEEISWDRPNYSQVLRWKKK